MEENNWQEKIDRLIIRGARVTDKGRLDFPDRIPFCPDKSCIEFDCIFHQFYIYLKGNGRIGDENTLAIGRCLPTKINGTSFPDLYSPLDAYSEEYYRDKILPIILEFYEDESIKELFSIIWNF